MAESPFVDDWLESLGFEPATCMSYEMMIDDKYVEFGFPGWFCVNHKQIEGEYKTRDSVLAFLQSLKKPLEVPK